MKKKQSASSKERAKSRAPTSNATHSADPSPGASFPIVGVGASAGGLEAFTQLLKALPADTGMGFVLVQHLDPEHESALTQILARATSLSVHEVTDNQQVQANHVYIIPPDTNLSIVQGVLKLQPRQRSRTPHRPIDSFFESLAQDRRERAIGVVLSGTASDGTLGLEAIKAEGGITFAQDDSAKYDSMPRSAVGAGCVDLILSPAGIANELVRIARHPYVAGQPLGLSTRAEGRADEIANEHDDSSLPSGRRGTPPPQSKHLHAEPEADGEEAANGAGGVQNGYRKIVMLLRNHSGVDFSLYKSNTIQRRISRRLVLSKLETLGDYAGFLRGNAQELDSLYSDLLISVTSFFRNPEMFDVLQREVFPKLLKQPGDDPIRVWVLGCSTGQEAYSIAMTFVEAAEKVPRMRKLQVFATDLNEALLDKARHGLYAKSVADDITPQRLQRFFVEEQGGYRVCKMLREMVVFARQNLIADVPFSRMDLVTCRNLLIYLELSLQKQALPTFHYALKPGGFLLLGASESIGGFTDLFESVDKKHKIYSRKPTPILATPTGVKGAHDKRAGLGQRSSLPFRPLGIAAAQDSTRSENDAQREADRITVSQFGPPGVLVNAELQVMQFRGQTGPFLEQPSGKASLDVLKMAREGLMLPLRAAINEAKKESKTARRDNVRIKQIGETCTLNVEVVPLKNLSERFFLILFEDAEKAHAIPQTEKNTRRQKPGPNGDESKRIAELESDLAETREFLQSLQEQCEANNEEFQSANEEVQSANEELQSINEELETSKEELESTNEELITVNEEMANRNLELDRLNNDLVNLQTSAKLAILLLGRDLTIRRFSPQAEKQFSLLPTDVGRPIGHIRHNLIFADAAGSAVDLDGLAGEVIADMREQEREVHDKDGRWISLRVRPYMTLDNKVDGAVLVLVDIDALKHSEQVLATARDYAENTIQTVREPLLVLDKDLRVESANRSFYRAFGVAPADTVGKFVYDLGNGQWNIPRLRSLLEEILPTSKSIEEFHVEYDFQDVGRRIMVLNARHIHDPLEKNERILLAIEDITERKRLEEKLRASDVLYRRLFETTKDGVLILDADTGKILDANPFMLELSGYLPAEFLGKELWEIGLFRDKSANEAAFRDLIQNGFVRYDHLPLKSKSNPPVEVEFVSNVYEVERRRVAQCNIRDITERSRLEKQTKKQAAELSELHRKKDEFLAMLSHELRSPLAPIANAVQLLGLRPENESKIQKQARGIIERQLGQLQHLIDDLLEVTRISTGRVQLRREPVTVNDVVQRALEATRPLIEQRRHEFTLSLPPEPIWLHADIARLEQVLVNLLTNAAKYTAEGGQVWLTVQQEGHECVLRVRDTGVGIAPELLPHIFDLFTQAERSLDRSQGGLGIGLALVLRLTELHGGKIEVSSVLGQGSEFVMRIPIAPKGAAQPTSPVTESGQPTSRPLRVLVVDDNEDTVLSFSLLLEEAGHDVQTAHDGPSAVQAAIDFRPDVMLLDIGLPGLNGYEVAKRIRKEPGLKNIMLVALTGYGQETDRQAALQAGFDHHLVKPARAEQLQQILEAVSERVT